MTNKLKKENHQYLVVWGLVSQSMSEAQKSTALKLDDDKSADTSTCPADFPPTTAPTQPWW
jgi:hypothetical protein